MTASEDNGRSDCTACGRWVADVGKALAIETREIPKNQRVGAYSIGLICPKCKRKVEVVLRRIHNPGTVLLADSD